MHNGSEVEVVHSAALLNLDTCVTESVLGSDRVQQIELPYRGHIVATFRRLPGINKFCLVKKKNSGLSSAGC